MTNAEKIRNLNDDELAMFLDGWECDEMPTTVSFCKSCGINDLCLADGEKQCWRCIGIWLAEEADEKEYATLFCNKSRSLKQLQR